MRKAVAQQACEMFEGGASYTAIASTLCLSADDVLIILRDEYEAGTVGDYYLTQQEMEAA